MGQKNIKKIIVAIFMLLLSSWLTGCSGSSNHRCDWCGSSSTKAYKIDDDILSYVCKECRERCIYCGEKATKHAPNCFDMETFMCDECYEEMEG